MRKSHARPCQTMPDIFLEEKAKCHWKFWESPWQTRRWLVFGERTRGNSDERQGWIDQFVRAGKAFAYVDGKPQGLFTGKKVTFIVATGGMYDAGTQMASFNHVEPYLRSIFGFIGVRNATFLTAGGTMALRQGKDRGTFLAPHIQAVQTHANQAH